MLHSILPGRRLAGAAVVFALMAGGTWQAQAQPALPEFDVPEYEGVDELPEILLRMTDNNSPTGDLSIPSRTFAEYVHRASNGKIQIEIFWAQSLMSFAETGRGVASGLADMGLTLPLYTPADFPVNNYFNQLSMLTDGGFPGAWLIVSGAVAEFTATNDDIQRELREFGVEPIGGWGTGGYDTFCTQPWQTLADAEGLRTRTAGQSFAFQAQALGMVPVPVPGGEVYEAFSRGILDCVILQPNSFMSNGLTDAPGPKYWVNVPLTSFNGALFLVNKEKWDSLPPLAQQILIDGQVQWTTVQPIATGAGFRAFGEAIRSGDVEAMSVENEVVARIEEHNASQLAALPDNAPEGITDPHAFVAEYRALVEKWEGIVAELGYPNDRLSMPVEEYVDSWFTDYDFAPFAARLREELAAAKAADN